MRIAVITPLRDEQQHLGRIASCLLTQTIVPAAWCLVDTGSTDATTTIASSLVRDHPWIQLAEIGGPPAPRRGASVVDALHHAIKHPTVQECDLILKLDADVSFGRDYVERLALAFEHDPLLGMASGVRSEWRGGRWRPQRSTATTVEAQARAYRVDCLEQLMPLHEGMGWDVVDESVAVALGWHLGRLDHAVFRHHRGIGQRERPVTAWFEQGRVAHFAGYRPTYVLARACRRALGDPAAVALLAGYGTAVVTRRPRYGDPRAIRARRRQQRLRNAPQRLREVRTDRRSRSRDRSPVDVLLVASKGGHLFDLWSLRRGFDDVGRLWVTEDDVDGRALLAGERAKFVRQRSIQRAPWPVLTNLASGLYLAIRARPRVVVSTGAAMAVGFVWAARAVGAKVVCIECGGRSSGRSLTTRLLAPLASRAYVQWPNQEREVRGSVYAGMAALAGPHWPRSPQRVTPVAEVVVLLGTCTFQFDRLVQLVEQVFPSERVVLQAGATRYSGAHMLAFDVITPDALHQLLLGATTVVAHAGVGSVAMALAAGKIPIVVPRETSRGEQIDDHQIHFARQVAELGLARVATTPDEIKAALAHDRRVVAQATPPSLADELHHILAEELLN